MSKLSIKPVRLHDDKASTVISCVSYLPSSRKVVDACTHMYVKLKGGDALICRALRRVGAHITFHYYYSDHDDRYGEEDFVLSEDSEMPSHCTIDVDVQSTFNGRLLRRLGVFTALEAPEVKYKEGGKEREREWEERKFTAATKFLYAAHGNEVTLGMQYASICMIASAPGYNIGDKWEASDDDW